MGWERRNGRLFYYRKVRRGASVRSEYLGRTEDAFNAARDVEDRAFARMFQGRAREHAVQERTSLNRQMAEMEALLAGTLSAALLANGYYQHRGCWRRARK